MLAAFRKDGDFIPISGVKGSLLVLTRPKSTSLCCVVSWYAEKQSQNYILKTTRHQQSLF